MTSADETIDWDAVADMRASLCRRLVLGWLADGPKYVTEITQALDYSQGAISRDCWSMKQRTPPLVACLAPDRPHHALYVPTEEDMVVSDYV